MTAERIGQLVKLALFALALLIANALIEHALGGNPLKGL